MERKSSKYYIGHATNKTIRYQASSGGVGTAFVKYLLESEFYATTLTFRYNRDSCKYEPALIHSFKDYNNCGSIYQDIDIVSFIKSNIKSIRKGIVVTCMPCQVASLRSLLIKNNIPNFIISFCCSGQLAVEGTWKWYEFNGFNKNDVESMQYRGNGWPSGISVRLSDGSEFYKDNWTEPWVTIHSSGMYKPKRCWYCGLDTSASSDISLADPWLPEFKEDKIGSTLFLVNTIDGEKTLEGLMGRGLIDAQEVDYSLYELAQANNLRKRSNAKRYKKANEIILKLIGNKVYHRIFSSTIRMMKLHIKLIHFVKAHVK